MVGCTAFAEVGEAQN
jgi:hypothetical protein